MTTLVFIWYLLTMPADKLICSLWINQPPSRAELIAACGTDALGDLRMDVVPLDGAGVICSRPASDLYQVQDLCKLSSPLDQYRIRILKPEVSYLVCSLALDTDRQPTAADVAAQCPQQLADWQVGRLKTQFVKQMAKVQNEAKPICAAAVIPIGKGLYEQPAADVELQTQIDLTWLAGRLIWFGLVRPDCGGASGLDPETFAANPCGLNAARSLVIWWQNQFDTDIFTAALASHVPARLLKKMMLIESQMWPLYSGKDETGMMQITANGADVLLRYDPILSKDYVLLKTEAQYWKRYELLNTFNCALCSPGQAVQRTHELIPMYARLLAAYRCRAVELDPALNGDAAWRKAVIDYNGSNDYLRKIEQ